MARTARALGVTVSAWMAVITAACGGNDPGGVPCEGLAERVAAATAGEVVSVGACQLDEALVVPDGVTVSGASAERTVIAGAVTLGTGARLERLTVRVEIGVAVRATAGSSLADVTLEGPVTPDNASSVPPGPAPESIATHGLLITGAADPAAPVTLRDVRVRGFARFGVLSLDSVVRWEGGSASDNLGVGIMARGGDLVLTAVDVCRTLQGTQFIPAYAAVFAAGARVETRDVEICDNEGFGALHDAVDATHIDFLGTGNSEPALWAQQGTSLVLGGMISTLSGNRIAGLVLIDPASAEVRDVTIAGTRLGPHIVDATAGRVDAGDGIQLVTASTETVIVENVDLDGNQRVGLLLDLQAGATVADGTLTDVRVDASGDAHGVIAQTPDGPMPSGSWDASVSRLGAAAVNDPSFAGRLDVVGIVAPMYLPRVD